MPSVQIEEAPPALRSPVKRRKNTHKCGELAGFQGAPPLHHQVRHLPGLFRKLGPVFLPPVAGGEQGAAAFESRAVKSHRDDHQQSRRDREGVSGAVD